MKLVFLVSFCALLSFNAKATEQNSVKCSELKEELEAMKKAQTKIISGLVTNHEVFASALEEYSALVSRNPSSVSAQNISKNMDKSAKATRSRGLQGKQMATRLESATVDLIERVSACLK